MDGGIGQAQMAEQVKREIKIKSRRRRGEHGGEPVFQISSESTMTSPNVLKFRAEAMPGLCGATPANCTDTMESLSQPSPFLASAGISPEA